MYVFLIVGAKMVVKNEKKKPNPASEYKLIFKISYFRFSILGTNYSSKLCFIIQCIHRSSVGLASMSVS